MNTFIKYTLSILGIGLVIGVHELGHFTFSKLFNVRVPTFSIGFGPALTSTKIGQTTFFLRVLPIGGYVTIAGYDKAAKQPNIPEDEQFYTKPYYQKVLIILGGILFNIGLGVLILILFNAPRIFQSMRSRLRESGYLKRRFIGPIGIINIIAETASYGPPFYIVFLGMLSINLGFFNLFPIPFLDGGQLVSVTFNAIQNQELSEGAKTIIALLLLLISMLILYIFMRPAKQSIEQNEDN